MSEAQEKPQESNLALWDSVCMTDPVFTSKITGKGYKGTSPKPMWIVRRMTEVFGPIGIGWGFEILSERMEQLSPDDILHIARVKVWYKWQGERGEVEQIGQTKQTFRTQGDKSYLFVDEDAPKKSVTDALVKAASYIGFAGDIFMGLYDDDKYVSRVRQYYDKKDADLRKRVGEAQPPEATPKGAKAETKKEAPKGQAPPPPAAGKSPDNSDLAEAAMDIERAKTDRAVLEVAKKIYGWYDKNQADPEHCIELAVQALRKRAELVDVAGLSQFKKMTDTFQSRGLVDKAECELAYQLARTRLNVVDPPQPQ